MKQKTGSRGFVTALVNDVASKARRRATADAQAVRGTRSSTFLVHALPLRAKSKSP